MNGITRRELAGVLAAVPLAGQTPAEDPAELRKQALERQRRGATALDKVKLPVDTEPAFVFRP